MNSVVFSAARAVFSPAVASEQVSVSQYGFYYPLDLSKKADKIAGKRVVIRLAARNIYRLYVNGSVAMHGPARTAHGYCRVDEVDITDLLTDGVNHIAIEVVEYGRKWAGYREYSNDCTLESGLLIAEIVADGEILSATGVDAWQVCTITARHPLAERISHSRECIEIYTINDEYYSWKSGRADFSAAVLKDEKPICIAHEALLPTLNEFFFEELTGYGAAIIDKNMPLEPFFFEANMTIFDTLPERPTSDCRRTVVNPEGAVRAQMCESGLVLSPIDTEDYFATWENGQSRVGFIRLSVTCERAGTIDIVRSEIISPDGTVPHYFNNVTRIHVPAGRTEFITMEPALARYMLLYFRGVGSVTVHSLSILDYSYPDEKRASFLCSDDNVNRIYQAAKRTMLLNTMDIFMDCPERERGGWLCDSLWTGRASALMLSDSRVEREHIENFLLTPADGMGHSFFPEVYPANNNHYEELPGFTTWSFWLMCEVCEFISRTGDVAFRDEHKPRVAAFVKGCRDFIGECGLIENMPLIFVDWSLANQDDYTSPVSSAANSLYAYMMISLGKTFDEPDWVAEGERVRQLLRKAVLNGRTPDTVKYIPDSFTVDANGNLCSRERFSEGAMVTALWCGLFTREEAPLLYRTVRDKMGPAPIYAKDPMVGESQLFIGLCIRIDMLARQGAYDKMYSDMLAICEPQLREGPGTLWEYTAIDTSSRCHGFTAHFGVHLMRDVLGLGLLSNDANGEGARSLEIAPHICGLSWARGTHQTPEGVISVDWRYDGESFSISVITPKEYELRLVLPPEVKMLDEHNVSVNIKRV